MADDTPKARVDIDVDELRRLAKATDRGGAPRWYGWQRLAERPIEDPVDAAFIEAMTPDRALALITRSELTPEQMLRNRGFHRLADLVAEVWAREDGLDDDVVERQAVVDLLGMPKPDHL